MGALLETVPNNFLLCVFGCETYPHIPTENGASKLVPTAEGTVASSQAVVHIIISTLP